MLNEYSWGSIAVFIAIVIACLMVDLSSHKGDKPVSVKSASLWTLLWIAVSLCFAGFIWATHGAEDSFLFLSGYALEKSLSIDNLFMMMAIFSAFKIADKYQHRVLYYGILGAMVLRMIFVALGVGFINQFGEIAMTVFGLFIIWSAIKMMRPNHDIDEANYTASWFIKLLKKIWPVHMKLEGNKFFVGRAMTPLFMCLVTIEFADILFAFDSVPAVIAITGKPFLVYTSNIFAILGMRSMYFCLSALKRNLAHLEKSVIAILVFIGVKMLGDVFFGWHISAAVSLLVILGLMTVGVAASLLQRNAQRIK
jgi:tellurite resistance protein TerC